MHLAPNLLPTSMCIHLYTCTSLYTRMCVHDVYARTCMNIPGHRTPRSKPQLSSLSPNWSLIGQSNRVFSFSTHPTLSKNTGAVDSPNWPSVMTVGSPEAAVIKRYIVPKHQNIDTTSKCRLIQLYLFNSKCCISAFLRRVSHRRTDAIYYWTCMRGLCITKVVTFSDKM